MELTSPERKSFSDTIGFSSPKESQMESDPNEKSINAVFLPHSARVEARFNAVDDLPEPPVRPDMAMILAPALVPSVILSICERISPPVWEPDPLSKKVKVISRKDKTYSHHAWDNCI